MKKEGATHNYVAESRDNKIQRNIFSLLKIKSRNGIIRLVVVL